MALYRCRVRGENFPGQLIGSQNRVGFYTTRFVMADSCGEAEKAGLELLREEPDLRAVPAELTQQEPRATVYFDEIVEVDPNTDRTPNSGFTWFEMDAKPNGDDAWYLLE